MLMTVNSSNRRSVICHYEAPLTAKGVVEDSTPISTPLPPAATTVTSWLNYEERVTLADSLPSNRALFMLADPLSPSPVNPTTVDGTLYLRVCHIIRAYGKYIDNISVQYFQGVHRWLPIISRSRFHDRLVGIQNPAVADFSILLLSMCLITHHSVCKFILIFDKEGC